MALCLSGDLDYDQTIRLIDKYFGELTKQAGAQRLPRRVEKPIDRAHREARCWGRSQKT
ncbi:MAG: hypothetical protein WKG07_42450 [Hymenobacter sp.]